MRWERPQRLIRIVAKIVPMALADAFLINSFTVNTTFLVVNDRIV